MKTSSLARARVYLNSRYIGFLLHKDGFGTFTYEDLAPDHPVLGLRFEYDPDYGSERAVSVPTWFANLLPERGSGLRALYARLLGRSDVSDFLLLVYLGEDLPGAVRVEVEGELPAQMSEALEAAEARHGRPKMSFSLSGMQLKFSMLKRGDKFILPDSGEFGDWIVKLPSNVYADMPANENAMMTWASAAGLEVPEHQLVPAGRLSGLPEGVIGEDELAFAVRRFDSAYDLASVTSYPQFRNDVLTLAIAGQPDTRYLELRHLRKFAESLEADPNIASAVVIETVRRLRDSWPAISSDPQVPSFVTAHVQRRLSTLPLAQA